MQTIRCVVLAAVMVLGAVPQASAQRPADAQPLAVTGDDPKRTLLVDLPSRPAHYRDAAIEAELRLQRELGLVRRSASADARKAWVCALAVVLFNAMALGYARFRTAGRRLDV